MGIKGLTKLLEKYAPGCMKSRDLKSLMGRKVAVDASMSLYQFLIQVGYGKEGFGGALTDADGNVTSHIQGLFYRTIRTMEAGVKPVFVFDGKPPTMKGGTLAERREARKKAEAALKEAKDGDGDQKDIAKYEKRLVRVTPQHNQEAQQLLNLMGVPVVKAPCEAEASCAELAKKGLVDATCTEDMDALTFGTPLLIRKMFASFSKKGAQIREFNVGVALKELKLSMSQFIDLCILCGCDYTTNIRGIGPVKAYKLILKHGSLEKALPHIDSKKYTVPEDFLWRESKVLFEHPEVVDASNVQLKWTPPKEEELLNFLVSKGFSEANVRRGIKRLKATAKITAQKRMDSFFSFVPKAAKPAKHSKAKKKPTVSRKPATTPPAPALPSLSADAGPSGGSVKVEPGVQTENQQPASPGDKRGRADGPTDKPVGEDPPVKQLSVAGFMGLFNTTAQPSAPPRIKRRRVTARRVSRAAAVDESSDSDSESSGQEGITAPAAKDQEYIPEVSMHG